MIQKSQSFILPMMTFNPDINKVLINTYLGNTEYEGENSWGKYMYIEFNHENLNEVLQLKTHPQYLTHFHSSVNNNIFFVFEITTNQRKIVDPFLEGKYSKIDRDYVNKYFVQYNNQNISLNWRILHKDENWDRPSSIMSLRDYWFSRIGIELPPNAELWSRPKMEDEIFNFLEENPLSSCP